MQQHAELCGLAMDQLSLHDVRASTSVGELEATAIESPVVARNLGESASRARRPHTRLPGGRRLADPSESGTSLANERSREPQQV